MLNASRKKHVAGKTVGAVRTERPLFIDSRAEVWPGPDGVERQISEWDQTRSSASRRLAASRLEMDRICPIAKQTPTVHRTRYRR